MTQRAVSDEQGKVSFHKLWPGRVSILALRGGETIAQLQTNNITDIELIIPRGVDVQGRVLDPSGQPQASAQVWISRPARGWLAGSLATLTDQYGNYYLRSVAVDRDISARSAAYGPSTVESLKLKRSGSGAPLRVDLQLSGHAGELRGIVLGPGRIPCRGAAISIGSPQRHRPDGTGRSQNVAPPLFARSDHEGRFRVLGVELGMRPVSVMAEGFAPHYSLIQIEDQSGADCELNLNRGFSVQGTVTDALGQPVPDATIHRIVSSTNDPSLTSFPPRSTKSDSAGRYRLDNLQIGGQEVEARKGAMAKTQFEAKESQLITWNPVLDQWDEIRGQLQDEFGSPLSGWHVTAASHEENEATPVRFVQTTDPNGGFRLRVEDGQTYAVSAKLGVSIDEIHPRQSVLRDDVHPGSEPLILVVDTSLCKFITGRLLDASGQVGDQDQLQVEVIDGFDVLQRTDVVDGNFRVGPLPPGDYVLRFGVGQRYIYSSDSIHLKGDQDFDAGELIVPGTGSVRLSFTRAPGLEVEQAKATPLLVNFGTKKHAALILRDGEYFADGVEPGNYDLMVAERNMVAPHPTVTVESGKELRMHVEFETCTSVAMSLDLSAVSQLEGGLDIALIKADGRHYYKLHLNSIRGMSILSHALTRGRWRLAPRADA